MTVFVRWWFPFFVYFCVVWPALWYLFRRVPALARQNDKDRLGAWSVGITAVSTGACCMVGYEGRTAWPVVGILSAANLLERLIHRRIAARSAFSASGQTHEKMEA